MCLDGKGTKGERKMDGLKTEKRGGVRKREEIRKQTKSHVE